MANSHASTRSSLSWFSSGTLGTKASSLLSSFSTTSPFPSLSDETRDSILALFAGHDAKVRLERKRTLAYFRSLPRPVQNSSRAYENDHAWAAAVGGTQIGQKTVDGVVYRYRISPELSLGESCNGSYVASGYIRPPSRVELETYYTDQRPSRSAFQDCKPCYEPPARSVTPEPVEERYSHHAPVYQSSEWRVSFNNMNNHKCWYQPNPPIPAARDISTVDYKLPGRVPRLTVIVEQPEVDQHFAKDPTRLSISVIPPNFPDPPIISKKEAAHQKSTLDMLQSGILDHAIPPPYQLSAHTNCFTATAIPVHSRIFSTVQQSLENGINSTEGNKNGKVTDNTVTGTNLFAHFAGSSKTMVTTALKYDKLTLIFPDENTCINPALRNDHKNATAYYQVNKLACTLDISWVANCKKSVSDWNVLVEYVKQAQNTGYRESMYSNIHYEYVIASQYFEQLTLEKEPSYLASLRASIGERKKLGFRTAKCALQQAHDGFPWAFSAGYYHMHHPTIIEKTESRKKDYVTHRVRGRKRRPVNGQGVKVVAPPVSVNPQPVLIGNEPFPEVPENAIVDTDSEDGWDPTCFIEPVKKLNRYQT